MLTHLLTNNVIMQTFKQLVANTCTWQLFPVIRLLLHEIFKIWIQVMNQQRNIDVDATWYSYKSRATWKQFVLSCSFFCSVFPSRGPPSKMSALPGSSLTTHPALDALAMVLVKISSVVWTSHYSILATVWPTTDQLKLQHLDVVHTLHSILPLLTIFSYQKMCRYLMSLCVGH